MMIKTTVLKRLAVNGILLFAVLGVFWFVQLPAINDRKGDTLYEQAMGRDIESINIVCQKACQKEGETLSYRITLKKVGDDWVMTEPLNAAVDPRRVQHLMTLLSERIEARYPLKGKQLSRFGLDKEWVSVAFNGVKIRFGRLNPVTHKRYVRKNHTLYVLRETVYGLLIRGVDGFIVAAPSKKISADD